jgi:hypothetical protein
MGLLHVENVVFETIMRYGTLVYKALDRKKLRRERLREIMLSQVL